MHLQLAAYAAVAVLIDWRIALLGGIAGVVLIAAMNTLIRISKRAGYKQTDRVSSLTVDMVDMLNNIKALKSMNRYRPLVQGLSGLLKRIKRSLVTIELAKHGVNQGSEALVSIMTGAVRLFGLCVFRCKLARNIGDWHRILPDCQQHHKTSKAIASCSGY